MARLNVKEPCATSQALRSINERLRDRLAVGSQESCPVDYTSAFVGMCAAQSCGKCTPCRVGLPQLKQLIDDVMDGWADEETIELIRRTANGIAASADCAIGWEAARVTLEALDAFAFDFEAHALNGDCAACRCSCPPCVKGCPAHVDIPGYMALTAAGRYTDAVRLIRHDNPLPLACGLICEHPCELDCRRGMVDNPMNIRGIKRFAVENSDDDYVVPKAEATGKKVAVIGGGPAGLTAAYFLARMGHTPVIFDQRKYLGGMMRYGIPSYRLPRERMQSEIDWILAQGVEARMETSVGTDVTLEELQSEFDAIYLAIGAHTDNKVGLPGEDAEGVISAVQMLRRIGDLDMPDYSGKRVVVIGGGNVAMDVARSSVRCGAQSVDIVYRRRKVDMTAQVEEIDGALEEGCNLRELMAPTEIIVKDGKVAGLKVQPQIIGEKSRGRFAPYAADVEPEIIECDLVLVAIGQKIDSAYFDGKGIATNRGKIVAAKDASVEGFDGIFAGGDCVSGPATVIRAIAAGKAAAANIDEYLGFNHEIIKDVDIPVPSLKNHTYCARSEMVERTAGERKDDFELMERCYSAEEALQEANRCLRCDHYGAAAICGGRSMKW